MKMLAIPLILNSLLIIYFSLGWRKEKLKREALEKIVEVLKLKIISDDSEAYIMREMELVKTNLIKARKLVIEINNQKLAKKLRYQKDDPFEEISIWNGGVADFKKQQYIYSQLVLILGLNIEEIGEFKLTKIEKENMSTE